MFDSAMALAAIFAMRNSCERQRLGITIHFEPWSLCESIVEAQGPTAQAA